MVSIPLEIMECWQYDLVGKAAVETHQFWAQIQVNHLPADQGTISLRLFPSLRVGF